MQKLLEGITALFKGRPHRGPALSCKPVPLASMIDQAGVKARLGSRHASTANGCKSESWDPWLLDVMKVEVPRISMRSENGIAT
jgi:hypothetical protein